MTGSMHDSLHPVEAFGDLFALCPFSTVGLIHFRCPLEVDGKLMSNGSGSGAFSGLGELSSFVALETAKSIRFFFAADDFDFDLNAYFLGSRERI